MFDSFFLRRNAAEIVTWVFLFLLVPTGVLGFYSETSRPGDLLYPMKETIDGVAIGYATLYNKALTFHYLDAASKKFQAADKSLLAENNTQDLEDFKIQILAAKAAAQHISDPIEKQQVQQKLLQDITKYQDRLSEIQTQLQSKGNPQTNTLYNIVQNTIPTNTPIPQQPTPVPSQTVQTIITVQNQLDQVKHDIQNDHTTDAVFDAIVKPTPTPTPTPTQTPNLNSLNHNTQVVSPTPTPTPAGPLPDCVYGMFNCSPCTAPANTCYSGNGLQTCIHTQPTPCNRAPFNIICSLNTCISGYICSIGDCVPPNSTPTPTPTPTYIVLPTPTPQPQNNGSAFKNSSSSRDN